MVFSGIVHSTGTITKVSKSKDSLALEVESSSEFLADLQIGASVCLDGVCLTVTSVNDMRMSFDLIIETLRSTTFDTVKTSDEVNLERSIKFGDEIGGHILSGHVSDTISINKISKTDENYILSFKTSPDIVKYIFPKGYVAINGVSLTVGDVSRKDNLFNVYLIPETLRRTNLSNKLVGDLVNVEIESQTRNTVDTITKITKENINV
ncbi:MAG: riboflavin synthase subunit alpha [Candidatus Poseidoniales archaeon]